MKTSNGQAFSTGRGGTFVPLLQLLALLINVALTIPLTFNLPVPSASKLADAPSISAPSSQTLSPLSPVAYEIAGGQTQDFIITLSAGQCLRATLTKADLNLKVTAFDPSGHRLREFFSQRYGAMTITFIVTTAGLHRLELRSLEIENKPRPYELRVAELARATPLDRQNDLAVQLSAEAAALQAQWNESAIHAAIEKYKEAWAAWRLGARPKEAAETLINLGDCYFTLGEFRQALSYFRQASVASRAARDRLGEIAALNGAARVFSQTGEELQVRANARRVLAYFKHSPSQLDVEGRRAEAEAFCHQGEAYSLRGKSLEALNLFDRALAIWTELGDRRGQALAHLNRGYAYSDTGDLQLATEAHQQALAIWRAVDERRGTALALTALGVIHSFPGEQPQALDFHRQAQKLFCFIGDHQGEALALNGLARAYEGLNELPAALDCYTRASHLFQAIGSNAEAATLFCIGRVHRARKETAQARDYFGRSLALSQKLRKQRVAAYALLELAALDRGLGRNQQALDRYRQVLGLYRQVSDRRGQAETLNRIGDLYQSAAQWRQALHYYEQALPLSQAVEDRSEEVETRYNLGRAARDGDRADLAFTHVNEALRLIESLRMGASGPALRASYFASVRKHYELYINLLMQQHRQQPGADFATRAFEASERARSRLLLDLLAEMKAEIREGVDPELLARERALEQSLSAKGQYRIRLLNTNSSEKQSVEVAEEIRRLSAEYNEVQARIREQSPRYATLKQPQPLQLWEVQKELPDDGTLLLEYFLGTEKSYLWAVTARTFAAYELPGRAQIEGQAREVYRLLTARQASMDLTFEERQARVAQADRQFPERAAALSELLLGPIAAQLTGNRLVVVADGALHYIPFEALPLPRKPKEQSPALADGEPENFVPLVLQHEVVSLPSATALAGIRRAAAASPRVSKGILVLADPVFERDDPRFGSGQIPAVQSASVGQTRNSLRDALRDMTRNGEGHGLPRLQATLQEAKEIVALTDQGVMVTGFDASRATAMSDDLQHYQIVHFATHGLVSNEHPEMSGIVLSLVDKQGNEENGFLQLHDIYNLRLSAELVTLSACSTGLGKEVGGEGLVGLTHGFMYAGAKRMLTSLWKVDDRATAELMQRFYRELLVQRKSPAAALRSAKVALLQQKRWQPPFYWGAFVFQGDPTSVITLSSVPWYKSRGLYLLTILSLILPICVYAYRWMKKRSDRRRNGPGVLP